MQFPSHAIAYTMINVGRGEGRCVLKKSLRCAVCARALHRARARAARLCVSFEPTEFSFNNEVNKGDINRIEHCD